MLDIHVNILIMKLNWENKPLDRVNIFHCCLFFVIYSATLWLMNILLT